MEMNKKINCPLVEVDGFIEKGKQFDLEVNLPEDNRDVIFGVIKDCFQEPVQDAVVKLIEIVYDCGKEEKLPVTHTFTDKDGTFVFGPLCPGKEYAIEIFVNEVKHVKMCAKCHREGKCLKGVKMDQCEEQCEKGCKKEEDKPEHKEEQKQSKFRY